MGWVDLDLNLPPPPPDPDGDTPLPSPTPTPEPEQGRSFFGTQSSTEIARVDAAGDASAASSVAVETDVQTGARIDFRVRVDGAAERAVDAGRDRDAETGSRTDFRVCDDPVDAGKDLDVMTMRREDDLGKGLRVDANVDVEKFSSHEQDANVETKVESEDDEIGVVSRVARARFEVVDAAPAAGLSAEREDVAIAAEDEIAHQKPVRKRLRTLGQLRNQKNERTTPVVSPEREKPSPSSSVSAATSNPVKVEEEDGKNGKLLKEKCSPERKLERSSGFVAAAEASKTENLSQQHEKMQVDGEEASSKKKVVAVKDANSDKRRRSIVVLEGEAQAPPKRPRLPRHPLKRTRSFGGVIVGENLDEGPKSSGKGSRLESPQSSESGKNSNPLGNGREVSFPSETAGTGSKESKRQVLKEDVTVDDNSRDVEMPQQVDNGSELAEGSGVSEEKQGDKARDVGAGVTVPRRPRKMKEIPVPPARAPRSTKPPPAVKPTEFIRPTVKKPSATAPLRRTNSTVGTSSRSDSRPAFQDTTIERLQREATCGKLWQSPGLFLASCNVHRLRFSSNKIYGKFSHEHA